MTMYFLNRLGKEFTGREVKMEHSYNQLFDEKDLLDKNIHQSTLRGCYKNQPQNRVLIQKIKINDRFNVAFKDLLDATLQNKLHIEIIEDEIVLVTKYLDGDNISLFMNFTEITEEDRLSYLNDYLKQAVAYIGLDNDLFNLMIASNQIVFNDCELILKEQFHLEKKLDKDLPFSIVAKNIGQVMQRLLITNYTDLKTSVTYDALERFTESLIQRKKEYQHFDELYSDFKAIYFKKSHSKHQTLLGSAHPNNIFMELVDVNEKEEANNDVTDEEKAFLMGAELVEEPIIEEPEIEEPVVIPPRKIDYNNGPIEESIDLSKLENASSIEDLLIQDTPEPVIKKEKINEAPTKEVPFTRKKVDDDPVGVPTHFKFKGETEEQEEKKINFLIPATVFASLLIVILGFFWLPKIFSQPEEVKPPVAMFEYELIEQGVQAASTSKSYGDAEVVECYWEITDEFDKVLSQWTVDPSVPLKVTGLSDKTYKLKLTVKDSYGNFSDPKTQEFTFVSAESRVLEDELETQKQLNSNKEVEVGEKELLDLYNTNFSLNVTSDTYQYHTGSKSYQLDFSEDKVATLTFYSLEVPSNSSVSFMLKAKDAVECKIHIATYKDGEQTSSQELMKKNHEVLEWGSVSVQIKEADKLVIRFESEDTILWFDDLSFRTFK